MKHRWMVLLLGLALTTVVLVVAPAHTADLAAPEQADPTWASTRVDAENTLAVSSRSLAIDGEDNLHAAYGSDRLYYAFSDGSGWQTTTVDYVWGTGQGRSIALDGDGLPHISYLDTHNYQLKYAYYDGAAWQIEVVAAGVASRYGWTAIDVDSEGQPRIAYLESTEDHGILLNYAYPQNGQWQLTTIDTDVWNNGHVSLELDSADQAHVSYGVSSDVGVDEARYATGSGISWITETVQAGNSVGQYTSLALDSAGQPHITYQDGGNADLVYARWTGSEWLIEPVADITSFFNDSSLILDPSDRPHITYNNTNTGAAYYLYWDGSQWQEEVLYDQERAFTTSLVLTGSGAPQVILVGTTSDDLLFLEKDAGVWTATTVDEGATLGTHSSLAIAPTAPYTTHISYAGDGVKYARFDGVNWHVETLDPVESFSTAVAVEPAPPHHPHVVYEDYTNDRIMHAYWTGAAWETAVVENVSQGGADISLAFAPNPPYQLHAAYIGASDVRYGVWDGNGWSTEVVAPGGNQWYESYGSSSIAVDDAGTVHLTYHGAIFDGNVTYATLSGATWMTETVEYAGNSYTPTQLALDASGTPHVAYSRPFQNEIVLASKPEADWEFELIAAVSGYPTSLVMDEADTPHLSYFNSVEETVNYATHDGATWHLERVDAFVSLRSALALDGRGLPRVAYGSDTGDLLLGWKSAVETIPTTGETFSTYGATEFTFPPGTFTDTVTLNYTALEVFGDAPNVGIFFDIEAVFADSGLPAEPASGETITITVHYDQADVPPTMDESQLALYYLDGEEWVIEPTSVVDTVANTIAATPDHLSIWAALVIPTADDEMQIFLPILLRP